LEFSNRSRIQEALAKPKINQSKDIYQLFAHLSSQTYEEFWIVILINANRVIRKVRISEGGITGTIVDQRRIFKATIDWMEKIPLFCANFVQIKKGHPDTYV